MIYRVKCTHCISLLMNLKYFEETPFRHDDYESYVEVEEESLANYIRVLEMAQHETFNTYQMIIKHIGEEEQR